MADLKILTGANGERISYSASSAETFNGCQRRWWFQKVAGIAVDKPSEDEPSVFGSAVHFALETYLVKGVLPPLGLHNTPEGDEIHLAEEHLARAMPSLSYLPKPGRGEVEAWVPSGIDVWSDPKRGFRMPLKGRIDWHGRAPLDWNVPGFEGYSGLVILDHKSKGSLSGAFGAKDEESLGHDKQGLIYAAALTIKSGHPPQDVLFAHNYIQRRGRVHTKLVASIMEAERIARSWEQVEEQAAQMAEMAFVRDQTCIPANTGYCNAFNKLCDFASHCEARNKTQGTSLFAALRSIEEDQKMSMWEAFKNKSKAAPPAQAQEGAVETTPEEPKGIQAPDAAPHDVTSKSQIREVADAIMAQPAPGGGWTLDAVEKELRAEGLHRDWRYNVGLMLPRESLSEFAKREVSKMEPYFEEYALIAPLNQVRSIVSDEYRPGFRADVLADVESDEVFMKLVKLVDHDVLLALRPKVEGKRQIAVDDVRASRGDGTPFDNAQDYRETLRAMWLQQRGGVDVTDDDIHESLKAHGYVVKRSKNKIAEVRKLLEVSKSVQTVKVDPKPPEQEPAPTVEEGPQPPEPPAPEVEETPQAPDVGERIPDAKAPTATPPSVVVIYDPPPAAPPKVCVLYVGCYTDGARPLDEAPLMKQAEAEVMDFVKSKGEAHWLCYASYGDNGARRMGAAVALLLARQGAPDGEWYFDPARSMFRDVPIVENFRLAGAKIVQRLG